VRACRTLCIRGVAKGGLPRRESPLHDRAVPLESLDPDSLSSGELKQRRRRVFQKRFLEGRSDSRGQACLPLPALCADTSAEIRKSLPHQPIIGVAQSPGYVPGWRRVIGRKCGLEGFLHLLNSVGPGRWSGQSGKELVLAEPFLHPERERTGNGSKPFWQWCVVTTPINSVAPSSMRRAVVNSWGNPTDSVWKSIFDCAPWPLLAAQKASKPVKNRHDGNVQPREKAQAAETKQRDVFGRPAGVGAECSRYRRWRTRNVCGRTSWPG